MPLFSANGERFVAKQLMSARQVQLEWARMEEKRRHTMNADTPPTPRSASLCMYARVTAVTAHHAKRSLCGLLHHMSIPLSRARDSHRRSGKGSPLHFHLPHLPRRDILCLGLPKHTIFRLFLFFFLFYLRRPVHRFPGHNVRQLALQKRLQEPIDLLEF